MKRLLLALVVLTSSVSLLAQTEPTEITKRNSWLKVGANIGIPFGDLSDYSSFTLGLDLKGQLMQTNHWGIGITTGYNHFFAKDDLKDFGSIPLGAFARYYPKSTGFFVGSDLGYTFLTNLEDADGGFYVRPQLGYHNYDWNIFAFYNGIFRSNDNGGNIQYAGIGATYNIRFK
ncbi:MAG: hypothetical protein P0Y53_00300 [Candidatus Pseudobacter hemicellulosilyticus]|uniref:Outer membrane protein beta-barrel domain-containing protein n=1 Tax=Candidatus Pseudobacter hemicellulosilyticus TaxID=3121375 RepID=A0AAJ5WTL4_9BACT|nr:MAG: hypothetical protein P0Y53_00300 [Pseudobacter sp.]